MKADIIVLGPGSLYTSVIPNLLVKGIAESIQKSFGTIVYVGNIMTQPGETEGYTLNMHVEAIEKYLGKNVLQYIIADRSEFESDVTQGYLKEHSIQVKNDMADSDYRNVISAHLSQFSEKSGHIRHNAKQLAEIIIGL